MNEAGQIKTGKLYYCNKYLEGQTQTLEQVKPKKPEQLAHILPSPFRSFKLQEQGFLHSRAIYIHFSLFEMLTNSYPSKEIDG
jgi:hypothetical protein